MDIVFIPYTAFYGKPPTHDHLKVLGCKCFVHIPKMQRSGKLAPVCETGMMVGYSPNSLGYRILVQSEDGKYTVVDKRDVLFDETVVGMDACFNAPPVPMDVDVNPTVTVSDGSDDSSPRLLRGAHCQWSQCDTTN